MGASYLYRISIYPGSWAQLVLPTHPETLSAALSLLEVTWEERVYLSPTGALLMPDAAGNPEPPEGWIPFTQMGFPGGSVWDIRNGWVLGR